MVTVTFVIIAVLCFVMIWKWCSSVNRNPPLAAGALPIVGHTFLLLANRDRLYKIILETMLGSLLKRGIETATIRWGTWKAYALMNPDDGLALATTCLEKDIIYDFFNPLFGQGLVNAEVPIWKKHRKLLNPTFNQALLNGYLKEFNRESRQLVKDLACEVGKGPFDQTPYVKHFTFRLIMSTAIGVNLNADDIEIKPFMNTFEDFTDTMVERSRRFWYHSDLLFSLSSLKKKQNALVKDLCEFTDKIIRERKQDYKVVPVNENTKPRQRAFLDLLLDLSEEGIMTDDEIRDEVRTMIMTGSDTTAHAICVILLVIGSYPEVQSKLCKELFEVFEESDRDVDKQDMSKLKYLEAVIKETMRLYPVIVVFGRIVTKVLNLKDYVLPVGSRCYVSVYNIGRHPMWGPDATQFRPERWLNSADLPTNHNAFAVFGFGKRNCIGANYAMMTIKTVLVHLLREYRVSGDVTNLVQRIDIIVRLISGHYISIERSVTKPSN